MSVSVVIPCYNRRELIGRAIASALTQSVPPAEVIVVDDGSRDGSAEVARSFGAPVIVIEQPNAGAATARNRGIEQATGNWIAFLDSDDEWHPSKLEKQLSAATRFPQAALVFCDTQTVCEERTVMPSRFGLGGMEGAAIESDGAFQQFDRALFPRLLNQSRVITSAVMVRRELSELRFPEDIWGSEDWSLWLTLGARYAFAAVNEVLVTMHQQGDNISSRKGRLYRNDLVVLERLRSDPAVTDDERGMIDCLIEERRVGALYFSLLAGETREARTLLKQVSIQQIGRRRHFAYRAATHLPPRLLRWIGSARLAELATI